MEVRGGGSSERSSLLGRAEPIKVNILVRILRAIARLFFPCCFPNAQERGPIEEGRVTAGAVDLELGNRTEKIARPILDGGGAVAITVFGLQLLVPQEVDSPKDSAELLTQLTAFQNSCSRLGTHTHSALFTREDLNRLEAQIKESREKLAELSEKVTAFSSLGPKAPMKEILSRSEGIILGKEESIEALKSIVDENTKLLNASFTWKDAKERLLLKKQEVGASLSAKFINEVASRYEAKAIEESAKSLANSLKGVMPKGPSFAEQYQLAQFEGGIEKLKKTLAVHENLLSQHQKTIEDFQTNIEMRNQQDLETAHARLAELEAKLKGVSARPRIEIPKREEKVFVDINKRQMELIEDLAATRLLTNEEATILQQKKNALNQANANLESALNEREEHWNSAPIEALPYMRNPNKLKYLGDSAWIQKDQSYLQSIAIAEKAANEVINYLTNSVLGNAERERSLSNPLKKPYSNAERSALLAAYALASAPLQQALSSFEKAFENAHTRRVERLQEINRYEQGLTEVRTDITNLEMQVDANRKHLLDLRKKVDSENDQIRQLSAKIEADKNINHAHRMIGKESFIQLRELCEGKLREELDIALTAEEKAAGHQKYFELIPGITGLPLGSAEAFDAKW